MATYRTPEQQRVIPFTVDSALSDVGKLNQFIDALLELGDKIKGNAPQLRYIQDELRMQELKGNFYTIAEVVEAMHCTTKTAMKRLEERGVEILDYGKTYVVFKDNFLNAFREVSYAAD